MNKVLVALMQEREGYVRRNLNERVAAIDSEIARLRNIERASEDKTEHVVPVEDASVEVATVEPSAERAVRKAAKPRKV